MERMEKIVVHTDIKDGKVDCVCKATKKKCKKDCEKTVVFRDKYEGWKSTFQNDRYGGKQWK